MRRTGSGLSCVEGQLFSHDAAALDQRLDAMARAVCEADPRTVEQRRADALGALAHGGHRLACQCGAADCAAADAGPSTVVVNVIAEEKSLADDTAVQLDGASPPGPTTAQLREMTLAEALAQASLLGHTVRVAHLDELDRFIPRSPTGTSTSSGCTASARP